MGVHGQTAASTKQCNKHKKLHHKKHAVCMCITYTVIIKIIPTAMWAAHAMQAAHTVWPADHKPDY